MAELKFIQTARRDRNDHDKAGNPCCAPSVCCGPNLPATADVKSDKIGQYERRPEWCIGTLGTAVGEVYRISTDLTLSDYWGEIRSRVSAFRMSYRIPPGLYAVGEPDAESEVLVTANYKLSFDKLRRELKGLNVWVLVLDTGGINVWCAAGKGTFGTGELIKRMSEANMNQLVNHRRIIVPQLGAPGIHAKTVKKMTGFRVFFGPVYARDVKAYISSHYKATQEMRTKRFTITERLVLTPMEINPVMKKFPLYVIIVLFIFGLQPTGIIFNDAWTQGLPFLMLGLISVIAGAFVTPLLLPFVPFRSFAVKGWIVGMLLTLLSLYLIEMLSQDSRIMVFIIYLFFPMVSSYIALQFTGSTSFTGISGVKKELKTSIPVYVTAGALSMVLLIVYKMSAWGIV